MPFNIHLPRLLRAALLAASFPCGGRLGAQIPCPPASDSALRQGWTAYRAGSLDAAAAGFARAERLCPANPDPTVGLGFIRLREGRLTQADSLFGLIVARDSLNGDGWEGRARVAFRRGDTAAGTAAGRRAMRLNPGNRDLRALLDRIMPDWSRPPVGEPPRPQGLRLVSRARGERFEVKTSGGWSPFYVKGVNLGVALPGRFPAEFPPDSVTYAGWIESIAGMHANALRVYTILPPSFYRALLGWNSRHPERALWLIHGVWTELPPRDDFDDQEWKAEFRQEMRRVVDLVHGAADIPLRPGHAGGRYDADVSRWTLAYIIGREWEPYAVAAFDQRNPGTRPFAGRYLEMARGPAADRWMAEQCDYMLGYEVERHNALRPIAYTNWPTLDPLTHPTEATNAEETRLRRLAGRPTAGPRLELENDAIGLDANLVRPTRANPAGWFASYHAYPYYPDFMDLDPGYRRARSPEGPSAYFGYLRELIAHHAGIPTLIAEYGVPSSRGMAHRQPQGWNHGGHDERAMAAIDARLTREIREAGAAGSIVFSWLDEWFKHNWAVIAFEIPQDHARLWHNVMDAEQHYGILGQYAGDSITTPRLGGDPRHWRALPAFQQAEGMARALRAGWDESYVYLAMELEAAGRFSWDSLGIQLAIDTYLPLVGQHRLPGTGVRSEIGFEFLVALEDTSRATIQVIPDYNRYAGRPDPRAGDDLGRFYRRPVVTADRDDGRFDSLFIITNRARVGRDGTFFPASGYDRGLLAYGTEAGSTLADWYLDQSAAILELRLPWDLLNVTDPSTRTLLSDRDSTGEFGTATAQGFNIGGLIYRKPGSRVVGALPALRDGMWRRAAFTPWEWPEWVAPRSHARLKPVYDSLRAVWGR